MAESREGSVPKHKRLKQALAIGLASATAVTAITTRVVKDSHHSDELPTNEPIVREIPVDIIMYPREFNENITKWETRVDNLLKVGSEIEVQKIEIEVQSGSEPIRLRSFPEFDLSSGELQSHVQAELPPGYHASFYGFKIKGAATDAPEQNDWYVLFLNPPTKGESPILAFLNSSLLTEESLDPIGRPIKIRMLGRDSKGFPAGEVIDQPGTAVRVGYLGLPPIAPKLDVA